MHDHPCLSCRLPDCDERSKGCALRRTFNAATWKRKHGLPMTEAERLAKREIEKGYELERKLRTQDARLGGAEASANA